jgi:hypothetical protein
VQRHPVEINPLMPWVRFIQNYDWQPNQRLVIAYRAGSVHLVKGSVAEQAIREGKAEPTERPINANSRRPSIPRRFLHSR